MNVDALAQYKPMKHASAKRKRKKRVFSRISTHYKKHICKIAQTKKVWHSFESQVCEPHLDFE
ncbi:hypothetical protein OIU79_015142 [Salix purpurea]|uniref:Uncharacterized protein n=1 Tax=Salix purpurea TaxID=77065 RepID=A0A9Q0PBA0_SALPP|nr:hypothetical protein OIU79_015142 [Salix purpurea]